MTASTGKYRKRGTGSILLGYMAHTKHGVTKFVHVMVAESVLGRKLPSRAVVHHVNGDRLDNRPANLVICNDAAYHRIIHRRLNALNACGHAHWRKCWICKQYDKPENLSISPNGMNIRHRDCDSKRSREMKLLKKGVDA